MKATCLFWFLCDAGVTVLVAAHSDDSDMLWLISSDNFPFRSLVSESHVRNIVMFISCASFLSDSLLVVSVS